MADTYSFRISHVGKEGTGYYGKRYGRIDERTTVTVQANSLGEAKNKVKNSPEVARNKLQASKRQAGDDTPRPRLVVRSIIQNPGQPDQKILKETAFQKEMRERENKQIIRRNAAAIKQGTLPSPQQLYKDGLITYQDNLKLQKELGSPGVEGQNIKSQPGGARFTTPLGRFTGMKLPPKKSMNEGGIVKGARGGMVRQFKGGGKVRIF
jgi:hypothetical protein